MELGVKRSGISALTVGIAGTIVGFSSNLYTLTEAMLIVTALNLTALTYWSYYNG
jgi:hypothetical protein